jgi:DNA/RNA-binding domain of Phe-tRNA-synthetase-like protein
LKGKIIFIHMKIFIDKELLNKTKIFRLGLLDGRVVVKTSTDEFGCLVQTTIPQIAISYKLEEVNKNENISATRTAYRLAGADPNRYRPSADALVRRIVKGIEISLINNVVDSLNFVSYSDGFSISGFDMDKIAGEISMGIGRKDEIYHGIGRNILNISGLPVLRDKAGAFGTPTSDSERTMITCNTSHILLIFYDFGLNAKLGTSLEKLKQLLIRFCSGEEIISGVQTYQ